MFAVLREALTKGITEQELAHMFAVMANTNVYFQSHDQIDNALPAVSLYDTETESYDDCGSETDEWEATNE